jgi:hypothetical protein
LTIIFFIPISSFRSSCLLICYKSCFATSVFGSNFKRLFNLDDGEFGTLLYFFYSTKSSSVSFLCSTIFEFYLLVKPRLLKPKLEIDEFFVNLCWTSFILLLLTVELNFLYFRFYRLYYFFVWRDADCNFLWLFFLESFIKAA